jgi:hypothetical protein
VLHHLDTDGAVSPQLPILTVSLGVPSLGSAGVLLTDVQALDDTGATANFISLDLAERLGAELQADERRTVSLGDQSHTRCHGKITVEVALDATLLDVRVPLTAYVVENLGFPLIIGFPFGLQYKKTLLYPENDDDGLRVRWTVGNLQLHSALSTGLHSDAQLHHMAVKCIDQEGVPMVNVVLRKDQPGDHPPPQPAAVTTVDKFEAMRAAAPLRLQPLLAEFRDIFIPEPGTGRREGHGVVAQIPTEPGQIAYTKQFPLPQRHLEELKKMLKELQDKGWVETAHSPYNNPIFLVPKPNGKWRIVLDFRGLNKITVKDKYRLPRVDHLLHDVMRWSCISTMDLVDGFYQIPLDESDRDKTAFTTPWGSYKWTVMPMGLTNAPSIFQGVTDALLDGFQHTVGYIDDLATGGQSDAVHDAALRELFLRIRRFGLHLSPGKCSFGKASTQFLGYQVGSGQLAATEAKLAAVRDFPSPTSQSQVRSFLGMVGYMQRLIDHFHVIAGPLEQLCGRMDKAPEWRKRMWGQEQEEAFQELKNRMASKPVLSAPRWDDTVQCPFILATDASGYGMGGVLLQRKAPGHDPPSPLGYWSRTFTDTEQRVLATHERELCALMEGLEFFHTTVLGYNLEVWCDHRPLEYLWTQPHVTPKQCRWAARIAKFLPFKFEYTPGSSPAMRIPDALSRKNEATAKELRGPLAMEQPSLDAAMRQGLARATHLNHMAVMDTRASPKTRYVLLLCSGRSRCVERYVRQRDPTAVVVSLDIDPDACPTLCGDVKDWKTLLARIPLPPGARWALVWASPDCTLLSAANTSGKDITPALNNAEACWQCIEAVGPEHYVFENPASGPRALHKQAVMAPYEKFRKVTSYCWYGAWYRKATSLWTNIPCELRPPCTTHDLCPCVQAFGYHPYTAQSGPSKNRRQEGMGSGVAVEGYPTRLLHALLDPLFGQSEHLFTMEVSDTPLQGNTPEVGPDAQDSSSSGAGAGEVWDPSPLLEDIRRALPQDPVYIFLRRKQGPLPSAPETHEEEDGEALVSGEGPAIEESPEDVPSVWEERYVLSEGLVRLREDNRLYVPQKNTLLDTIVDAVHQVGHFGRLKCYQMLSQHLWWPNMGKDVATRIAGCRICQKAKCRRQRTGGELQPLPLATAAWRSVSIDWISGLPPVKRRASPDIEDMWTPTLRYETDNEGVLDSLLVMTCRYSKAVRIRACTKSGTHADVVDWLKHELFRIFGWPDEIISDNDPKFAEAYRTYMTQKGVELHFTSGHHPRANGQAERSNSTVLNVLRCLANGLPGQWPDILPDVEFAINSTPGVHGVAPFALFLQFPPRNELEAALGVPAGGRRTQDDAIHELVKARLVEEQARQKAIFDRTHPPLVFEEGDHVYLRRASIGVGRVLEDNGPGRGTKLRTPFLGPYRVIRRKRNCHTYVLDMPEGHGIGNQWHVSHLVPSRTAGSAFDSPIFLEAPAKLLAVRRDLQGMERYLTLWEGEEHPHSWERPEHLNDHPRGRQLLREYRRNFGRTGPSTSNERELAEHPEWLAEVVG